MNIQDLYVKNFHSVENWCLNTTTVDFINVRKLPAAAILKFKRQKRKHGEDNSDSSDFDETPPRSPVTMLVDEEGEVMQVGNRRFSSPFKTVIFVPSPPCERTRYTI